MTTLTPTNFYQIHRGQWFICTFWFVVWSNNSFIVKWPKPEKKMKHFFKVCHIIYIFFSIAGDYKAFIINILLTLMKKCVIFGMPRVKMHMNTPKGCFVLSRHGLKSLAYPMTQLFTIFKVWRNLQNRQHTWLKLTLLLLLKSQKWFKIKSSVNEVLHFPLKASDQLIEAKELTYVMQSFAPLLLA